MVRSHETCVLGQILGDMSEHSWVT